ncbi:hypothetical protein ACVBEF_19260 [Glaciimonas sp. GG7]
MTVNNKQNKVRTHQTEAHIDRAGLVVLCSDVAVEDDGTEKPSLPDANNNIKTPWYFLW